MASAPSRDTRTPQTAPFRPEWPPRAPSTVTSRPQRARTLQHERRAGTLRRWAFRLALASPYVALALFWTGDQSANAALDREGAAIAWGSDDLSFVSTLFPPLPAAVAGLAPFGARGAGLAGALVAGVVLGVLAERLSRSGLPFWLVGALLAGLGGMPVFGRLAVGDLGQFLVVALLSLGLAGMVRFAADGDTGGGFTCGLAMGAAVMCDLSAVLFTAMLAVACAVIIRRHGFGGADVAPGLIGATVLVIVFPAASALLGWAFLEWRFAGTFFEGLDGGWGPSIVTDGLAALDDQPWRALGEALLRTPVFLAVLILSLFHRRWLLALLLPVLPLVVGLAVALGLPLSPDECLLVLGVAAVVVPVRPGRVTIVVLSAAIAAQLGLGWLW
ncbi:hypothetical protein [Catenuloplanes japonicus]|uniref:hypothetical protein n=1 Tax=Catenuloplanes japonicus TaxID=33876 RepID=UPI000525482A|nr:hypothetical protein [Catenuloplanes japonicus]